MNSAVIAQAIRYQYLTECYDRVVCSGPIIRGSILPATRHQRFLVAQHARRRRDEMIRYLVDHSVEFTDADVQRALEEASRYRFERLKEIYEAIFAEENDAA